MSERNVTGLSVRGDKPTGAATTLTGLGVQRRTHTGGNGMPSQDPGCGSRLLDSAPSPVSADLTLPEREQT